jgi:bud site selection protein 31
MFYQHKKITREVYEFALREKYADASLIAKWKKTGYERLCCLRCVQAKDTNFGTTCICRVPSSSLEEGKVVECVHCGCRGCASGSG